MVARALNFERLQQDAVSFRSFRILHLFQANRSWIESIRTTPASGRAEHRVHELIVADMDPAVAVGVETLE